MNNETQMVKGILEGCILNIIEQEEIYGYRIVEILETFGFDVNEATVYPILARLQNKNLLEFEKKPSPYGPQRKYYSLTGPGRETLSEFRSNWVKLRKVVDKVLEGEENDHEK